MKNRIQGYIKRARFEYSMWNWRRQSRSNTRRIQQWQKSFQASSAEVVLGAHLGLAGGVRNHLLAIKRFSRLNVELVPTEEQLQKWGIQPFYASAQHVQQFVETPPPPTAFAVHTHVFPQLINWAKLHAPGKLRWVHTHHLYYYPEHGETGLEPWQQRLNEAMIDGARNADVCLSVNRWEQEMLLRDFGIRAHFVPNGVDVEKADSSKPDRFLKNNRITAPFALWVGRLDPVKNPLAFVKLALEHPELSCVMIGGITKDDIRREYNTEPPANLKLLPALSHEQTLDAIAACKALVVTSHREGLPTLVMEGMALRRSIVIPQERGCMDATDGATCARIYTPEKSGDLNEKVLSAMADSTSNAAGRERAVEVLDWRVVTRTLDEIYKGKLPDSSPTATL